MGRQQEQRQSDPALVAIERVLKIERDGVEQLQRSRERAAQLVSEAREQATAMGRRADACISRLHNSYLQKVERDVERLAQSDRLAGEHASAAYDRDMLVRAVRLVAAKLTGGT